MSVGTLLPQPNESEETNTKTNGNYRFVYIIDQRTVAHRSKVQTNSQIAKAWQFLALTE